MTLNGTDVTGSRGVSPVIGVILMVGIVVILAAVVAILVTGVGDEIEEPRPEGAFKYEYYQTGKDNTDNRPYVEITHRVGETVDADDILIIDESGNTIKWSNVWTGGSEVKAGEFVHIDGFGSDSALDPICEQGDTYRVVLRRDDGTTKSVYEWTAPTDPNIPAGSSDSNGDGIPDWC